MAEFELSTYLDAPPDAVWEALQFPATMAHVAWPMLTFKPIDPPHLPERWSPGDYLVSLRFFGLPIGRQVLGVSVPPAEGDVRYVRDLGGGGLARVWDHLVSVAPEGNGTRYADHMRVEAGWLTPLVAGFAWVFYHHRQRRWRRFVAGGLRLR